MLMRSPKSKRSEQRGLSIVELMVGVAVGLFIVGGATKLFVDYLVSNKRLLLETRVNQELRAAADLVARDVRRAGYWTNATAGLWSTGGITPTPNPHATTAGALSSTGTSVNYSYARNADNSLDANEYAGFRQRLDSGINVLEMQLGQNVWQALTDPATVNVTAFNVTATAPTLVNDLSSYCSCLKSLTCTMANIADPVFNPAGAPTLTIPSLSIVLTGRSVVDSSIERTLRETVRVRNAILTGACPP